MHVVLVVASTAATVVHEAARGAEAEAHGFAALRLAVLGLLLLLLDGVLVVLVVFVVHAVTALEPQEAARTAVKGKYKT